MILQHYYHRVPGWFSYMNLYRDVVKQAPSDEHSIFVEVGSWKGKSTSYMGVEIINSEKPIRFFAVDHWLGSNELAHVNDPDVKSGRLYEVFRRNIKPVQSVVNPLRMSSVEAAGNFEDKSVDFIMLDGGHDYASVFADLRAWLPKMKPGGIVSGDDWNWSGVKQAVNEVFDENQIEVLGDGKGRHWRIR